jgi:hypothetical protein
MLAGDRGGWSAYGLHDGSAGHGMARSPFVDGFHEPELMKLMTRAYLRASMTMHCTTEPVADELALNIFCAVAIGERDPERLQLAAMRRPASAS